MSPKEQAEFLCACTPAWTVNTMQREALAWLSPLRWRTGGTDIRNDDGFHDIWEAQHGIRDVLYRMMVITTMPVGYRKDARINKIKWVYRFSPPYRSLLPPRKDTYQRSLIQKRVAYCAMDNSSIAGIALSLFV